MAESGQHGASLYVLLHAASQPHAASEDKEGLCALGGGRLPIALESKHPIRLAHPCLGFGVPLSLPRPNPSPLLPSLLLV